MACCTTSGLRREDVVVNCTREALNQQWPDTLRRQRNSPFRHIIVTYQKEGVESLLMHRAWHLCIPHSVSSQRSRVTGSLQAQTFVQSSDPPKTQQAPILGLDNPEHIYTISSKLAHAVPFTQASMQNQNASLIVFSIGLESTDWSLDVKINNTRTDHSYLIPEPAQLADLVTPQTTVWFVKKTKNGRVSQIEKVPFTWKSCPNHVFLSRLVVYSVSNNGRMVLYRVRQNILSILRSYNTFWEVYFWLHIWINL